MSPARFRRLQRDAEKGEAWALRELAKLYQNGANFGALFIPKDEAKARELDCQASKANNNSRKGRLSELRIAASEEAEDIFVPVAATAVGAMLLLPLAILGWQIYRYLMDGYWTGISVVDALAWMGSDWAAAPASWFGVHNILSKVGLAFASIALLFMCAAYWDKVSRKTP